MKLQLINFGKAGNNTPNQLQNAAVAGMPYSAHVGNVDHEAQKVIDAAQSHEFAIPGELTRIVHTKIPYITSGSGHVWNNAKHLTHALDHIPIPWLEG